MTDLPHHPQLAITPLSTAFKNTATSYKFYWFLALLKAVEQNQKEVLLEEVLVQMIVKVWYPTHFYKINFGIQDQLRKVAKEALEHPELDLKIDTEEGVVFKKINHFVKTNPKDKFSKNVLKLGDYVPFRWIRPWLVEQTRGMKDNQLNQTIRELATGRTDLKLPYYFKGADKLILDSDWLDYLRNHFKILQDFCCWNLLAYLQKRNPNVPNIAAKLFPPTPKDRSLTTQHTFWKKVLDHQKMELRCVYSNEKIEMPYALDHFLPWSFVTHNQLWNLVPIAPSVNSQKSNHLPKLEAYFDAFASLQYQVFQGGYALKMNKRLEDYLDVFNTDLNEIHRLSEAAFKAKLYQQIAPLSQIAANMGFTADWTFSSQK